VDVLAWAPPLSTVFSVKSVYWLDTDVLSMPSQDGTSREPNGRRGIWLPGRTRKINMELTDTFVICGVECENTFADVLRWGTCGKQWWRSGHYWCTLILHPQISSGSCAYWTGGRRRFGWWF
jgi:hypothetical protein